MKNLVFVYGSLKRGYHGHSQMTGATFASEALTRDPLYRMVAFPWPDTPGEAYPGILPASATGSEAGFIAGEVYNANPAILNRLDEFEVAGRDYIRERTLLADGRTAWIYLSINIEAQGGMYEHARIGFDPKTRVYRWIGKGR